MATHYGIGVVPARSYKPPDKAKGIRPALEHIQAQARIPILLPSKLPVS
jgi:hypothetical protein